MHSFLSILINISITSVIREKQIYRVTYFSYLLSFDGKA